jgi:hypothetical protein
VLLAWGADLGARDASGKTPFGLTPGYPKCEGKYSDESDCPKVGITVKVGGVTKPAPGSRLIAKPSTLKVNEL